jgi:hypothetical protein
LFSAVETGSRGRNPTKGAAVVADANYLMSLGEAADVLEPGDVHGVLVASAPVVGSVRVVAASSNLLGVPGLAMEAEEELEDAVQTDLSGGISG